MIYLIDNQLPLALVQYFQSHSLEATHVSQCGLQRASDIQACVLPSGIFVVSAPSDSL